MVFARSISTRIEPYFGYRSTSRLVLSARALRSAAAPFAPGSGLRSFRIMMSQFASREAEGLSVRLAVTHNGNTVLECERKSDSEGFVHFDEALPAELGLPDCTSWSRAELHWSNAEGSQSVDAQVLAPGAKSNLGVISDIDDTIIESGITGGFRNIARNWKRVLAQMPTERLAVPGAARFFEDLKGAAPSFQADGVTAPSRPFFYVSSSPWNLFSYLVAFKEHHRLPLGPLLLRDWGLNRKTLGASSHGSHKTGAISAILSAYPGLRFTLIGDDTQGDLPAFAKAAKDHPRQVAAVFLRKAASDPFSQEELSAKRQIEQAGIPLWMGKDFTTASSFLHGLDLP